MVSRCDVGREFAHLIHTAVIGVFVSHAKHIVGIHLALQRHIAERGVDGVLAFGKQTGALHFLVVASTFDAVGTERGKCLCDGVDVACFGILLLDDAEQIV